MIHFFHTNDVHSHLEDYLQIATQLRRHRAEVTARGELSFSFDIGDHADRKRMETEGTYGQANAALLREVGYDALTFGNNEGLTLPRSEWSAHVNEAQTPLLVANLFDREPGDLCPLFEPYLILEREDLRIGVLGLTVPFFEFYEMHGLRAEHPRETFARLLPEMKGQNLDLIVLLSHLGLQSDRQIASEIDGIDIILGGHTHHALHEPERIGGTIICQAGCYGAFYGHLAIEWDPERREVTAVEGGVIPRDREIVPDADLSDLLAHWQERADESLNIEIGELPCELDHDLSLNSPLAHALTDRMREKTGADFAMINGGMFNHGLLAGAVMKRDLLTCFPSPSITCIVELTGSQILSVLAKSLLPDYVQRIGKGYGFRGHFVGGMQVSGLDVTVLRLADGSLKVRAAHGGAPLEPERRYAVAATDYLYFSGVYEEFKESGPVRFELPFLREVLEDVIRTGFPEETALPRWTFEEAEENS